MTINRDYIALAHRRTTVTMGIQFEEATPT